MKNRAKCGLLIAALLFLFNANSQVRLPRLISDGLVLQRDTEVYIWGWAAPCESVRLDFIGNTYTATAGQDDKWTVKLPSMKTGEPYDMNIKASNQLTIKNVLFGDVWVCSGQSNMELTMQRASPIYQQEIAGAENDNTRYFDVPDHYDFNQPQDVGKRLALAAQKLAYGDKKVVHSGPLYKSMRVKGNKVVLNFSNVGSGLMAKGGGELKYFAIAGADHQWLWAKAKIEGDKVLVWSDRVAKPVADRYARADNPEGAHLYNREGLPASPFRTDRLPLNQ